MKDKTLEEAHGKKGYLIPVSILPKKLEWGRLGGNFKRLTVDGTIIKIGEELFFEVLQWKL